MIMCGKSVTALNDKLMKIPEDYLVNSLRHPKPEIDALIKHLRILYTIDNAQYGKAKRSLPYIVCGIFKPENRKKENFAYIDRFMLDIDHLSEKGMTLAEVREKVNADKRVYISFASPSEDGLKVMFRMKERCYDAGQYSVFYKEFLRQFSQEHHLEQVVDKVTSDVSRACFMSVDPEVFYNPESEEVDMATFVNTDNPMEFFDLKREQEQQEKEMKKTEEKDEKPRGPEEEVMRQIKERLGVGRAPKVEKPVFVPEELQAIMDEMKAFVEEHGLLVKEIINISYGKKVRAQLGRKQAEVNVFYGRRGFTVAVSPRSGTDEKLNILLKEVIEAFLNS